MSSHKPHNDPNKHHIVPASYIEKWANGAGKVIEFRLIKGAYFSALPKHPNATGYAPGIYALPSDAKEEKQFIEKKILQPIDTHASIAHSILLSENPDRLNSQYVYSFSKFINSLVFRRISVAQQLIEGVPNFISKQLDEDKGVISQMLDIGLKEAPSNFVLKESPAKIKNSGAKVLANLLEKSDENINEILMAQWEIFDFQSTHETLLLGDNAPLIYNIQSMGRFIWLPLCPTKALLIAKNESQIDFFTQKNRTKLLRALNSDTVIRSDNFVWANDRWDTPYLHAFVKKRMKLRKPFHLPSLDLKQSKMNPDK